ncbi:hypothetical protein AB4Z30_11870 [Paenibacillus sp. 2TAF8]|uniref:hypothetical protein n=1 Tax=Paenibacillus sp. 2TAF8 TaxID=3233020 RepID=UPI003F9C2A43
MRLRKLITVLLTSMLLLTLSSSVFASEITPTAIGIGDTRDDAISLIFANGSNRAEYSLFLQNNSDQDWFKWTNTTDKTRFVRIESLSEDRSITNRLGIQYDFNNGYLSTLMYADTSGISSGHIMNIVPVPPGATIYMVVDAPTLYGVQQYKLFFYDFESL